MRQAPIRMDATQYSGGLVALVSTWVGTPNISNVQEFAAVFKFRR
jgi:hypothetical protein